MSSDRDAQWGIPIALSPGAEGGGGGAPTLGDPKNKKNFPFLSSLFSSFGILWLFNRGLFKRNGVESRKDALARGKKSFHWWKILFLFSQKDLCQCNKVTKRQLRTAWVRGVKDRGSKKKQLQISALLNVPPISPHQKLWVFLFPYPQLCLPGSAGLPKSKQFPMPLLDRLCFTKNMTKYSPCQNYVWVLLERAQSQSQSSLPGLSDLTCWWQLRPAIAVHFPTLPGIDYSHFALFEDLTHLLLVFGRQTGLEWISWNSWW